VCDMYDLRGAIEALTVRRATQNMTPQAFERLEQLAEAYEAATRKGDQPAMLAANQALHTYIGELGDNPEANRLMEKGWELIIGIRNRFGFSSQRIAAIVGEHRRLIEAMGRRQS